MDALTELLTQFARRPRLMIVDDQPIHIRALCAIFKEQFDISIATSGRQALALCAEIAPDLVLLDVVMPEMDGFEVCRQMQQMASMGRVPVVFLTAMQTEDDQVAGFRAGASDFIAKPFNATIVRARVERLLAYKIQSDLLGRLAMTDGLTGLANRRRFDECIVQSWSYCQRFELPIALLMIDVDHFKLYNDHYGHPQGDACLQAVASVMKGVVERPHDLIARYGGEEFACLLPGTDLLGANHLARQINQRVWELNQPHEANPRADRVTVSIGVACCKPGMMDAFSKLVEVADKALYLAKSAGRNCAYSDSETVA